MPLRPSRFAAPRGTALALIAGAGLLAACATTARKPDAQAAVSAANPLAVEAGLNVLRAGGSAVDAAVAIQATLGLVEPQSSGLGGGAFMLHYDGETGAVSAYDGRERAPAGAGPDLFIAEDGSRLGFVEAKHSGLSIGVPGVMDMLALAHAEHGSLAWNALFDDAIGLAEDGFAVSPRMHSAIDAYASRGFLDEDRWAGAYLTTPFKEALPVGHVLKNPAYADTLRALAANPRALNEGPIAAAIVEAATSAPRAGSLTLEDLASYRARKVAPLCADFVRDAAGPVTVCGMPAPSSGGLATLMILQLTERLEWVEGGADAPLNWALFSEAQRLAYADRDQYAADDVFVAVPTIGLLSDGYSDTRAALIRREGAINGAEPGNPWPFDPQDEPVLGVDATAESPGTSHFVVRDAAGDVVSMTTTVEGGFGSLRMAGGFLLNNQLTDFSFRATDTDGRPIANRVEGGKAPRSSMSPTLVLADDGTVLFATGSPGGSSIIAYVAKHLIGVLDWGLSPQEAADLPNLVARSTPIRIEEDRASPALIEALSAYYGAPVNATQGENSGIHALYFHPDGTLSGAADPRREGVVGVLEPNPAGD